MKIDTHFAESFGEYMEVIQKIAGPMNENGKGPVLWFRGMSDTDYSLIPSLVRQGIRVKRDDFPGDYSALHYAEDIRTQHYIAKNYHFFSNPPASRVEWLEVMQHHRMNTRVLDWSESSVHSLIFAIEPFLNNINFEEQSRRNCVPCVWVLEPCKLNREIFKALIRETEKESELVKYLLAELEASEVEEEQILASMKRFAKLRLSLKPSHLDYIINLSVLNDEILRDRSRLKYLLKTGDIVNPFFYLLSRIYSDGHILKDRKMPPLAVIHPYHSERIKAQRGVFAVFPFYEDDEEDETIRQMGFSPDAMENNVMAASFLHKIVISRPQKITYELITNGMSDSWLYPEMPIVSSEIECRLVHS